MMEQEEKDIELVEAYMKGTLSPDERADFEKRRETDTEFANQVDDYLLIMNEIRSSQEREFVDKLRGWERDLETEKANVIPLRKILSMAAAVLIIFISLSYLILEFLNQKQTTNELFAAYFHPYEDVISQRSGQPNLLQQGMGHYNNGNYAEAITYLQQFLNENPNHRGATCYLGLSYLANDQATNAREQFEKLQKSEPDLFAEVAEWNLALLHLKLERVDQSKAILESIKTREDHLYHEKAEVLIRELP